MKTFLNTRPSPHITGKPHPRTLRSRLIGACLPAIIGCLFSPAPACAQPTTLNELRGGGAFDTVDIAGFLVRIDDLATLHAANILRLNDQTKRFGFTKHIGSERALKRALRQTSLQDQRTVLELYRAAKVPLPNGASHTLTVPSAYGPAAFVTQNSRPALSVSFGGVSRVPYTNKPDGGIGLGLSFGNAFDTLGVSIGVSLNDLSDLGNTDRMSFGFALSRYLTDGLSVAIGGENLFVQKTDGQSSFYAVASLAFDADSSSMPFDGVLTFGAGTGRFAEKTPRDIAQGHGVNGTTLFGALAIELNDHTNLIADWNGRNLTVGAAFRIPRTGVSLRFGVRDLTGNSGDGPRLTGSIGFTLARF